MATSVTTASRSIHLLPNRPAAAISPPAHLPASRDSRASLPLSRWFLPPPSLRINQSPKPYLVRIKASSTPISPIPLPITITNANNFLSESTRTISSLIASAVTLSKLLLGAVESVSLKFRSVTPSPTPEELTHLRGLKDSLLCSAGPLFFAAIGKGAATGARARVSTPVSLVAGAVVKWLDIYGGILMVRVLLSWFPNIPWERQPLSAIRDLCDPYLNLFRGVIPPLFNTMDISPLFAFLFLGSLSALLSSTI